MKTTPPPVPELLLEQLALGEIAPADERWLRTQLDAAEIERRLVALRAADEQFHTHHPTQPMVSAVEGRVRIENARREAQARSKPSFRYMLPGLAALACALVWFAQPTSTEDAGVRVRPPETILVKGLAPHLVLYRRVAEHADRLSDGARARRGDMLQVGYVAERARHGVIVSIDGAGAVTLHFPDSQTASTQLEGKGEQLLMHAYELDAAPGFERFFFVTGQQPIEVGRVLNAARDLARAPSRAERGSLSLESVLTQSALTLVKE